MVPLVQAMYADNEKETDKYRAAEPADKLYAEYLILHDYFGRSGNGIMKWLKKIRNDIK
ncbi:MAG: hypothetical protein KAU06_09150 [Candidatus Marinimicrobia bacterium]|nr:hypothetical protein [Candidatus Neomarinimicrobiota bacterium]